MKKQVNTGFIWALLLVMMISCFALVKLGSNFIHYSMVADALELKRPKTQALKLNETAVIDLYGSGFGQDMAINLVMDATAGQAVIMTYPLEGVFNESLINKEILYLGTNKDGLKVLSLAEPDRPRLIGEYLTGKSISGMQLKEDQLFLACGSAGVIVMQVERDGGLTYKTAIKTASAALATRLVNGVLVVATRQDGVLLYDISRATAVSLVNRLDVKAPVMDIDAYKGYLYAVSAKKDLVVFQINGFHDLVKVAEIEFGSEINGISITRDCLYLTTASGVLKYGLHDPAAPDFQQEIGGFSSAGRIYPGERDIYVTDSSFRLSVIDPEFKNSKQPISLTSDVRAVAELGNYLYVAGSESGLLVLDRRNLSEQAFVRTINTRGNIHDIFITGHFLYIADASNGILLKDLNSPDAVYTRISPRWGQSFCVDHDRKLLFVALGRTGVEVFDIADPGQPVPIAVWPEFVSWRLAVAGDYLVSAQGVIGIELIDISNIRKPVVKMAIPDVHALDIVFDNHLFYIADKQKGLQIYAIDAPGQLRLVSTTSVPFPMNHFANSASVAVRNAVAYVANGRSGLLIVDVKHPGQPQILGSLDIPGFSNTVRIKGEKAFVGSAAVGGQYGGISVVDIKKPGLPRYESYISVQGLSRGMQVVDDLIYTTQKNIGVTALPVPSSLEHIHVISSQHVRADLPPVKYAGRYDLQINSRAGSVAQEGAISYR